MRRNVPASGSTRTSASVSVVVAYARSPGAGRQRDSTRPGRKRPQSAAATSVVRIRSSPGRSATDHAGTGGSIGRSPGGRSSRISTPTAVRALFTCSRTVNLSPCTTRCASAAIPNVRAGGRVAASPATSTTANGAASAASSGRPLASAASNPVATSTTYACRRGVPDARVTARRPPRGLPRVASVPSRRSRPRRPPAALFGPRARCAARAGARARARPRA